LRAVQATRVERMIDIAACIGCALR
jgi:hypothetical protein